MDALILSCSTGGGHDSAAKAIRDEMKRRGHRALVLNPYELVSEKLAGVIDNGYVSMAKYTPLCFGAVYQAGELFRNFPFHSPVYFANSGMVSPMNRFLSDGNWDVIFTTHVYPGEILANMKRRGIPVPKTVMISTDYACTPFIEESDCDAYVTPAPDLDYDFFRRGIPLQKLYSYGIPTSKAFAPAKDKESLRRAMGWEEGKKYVLITAGSMGCSRIKNAVFALADLALRRDDIRLVVVCGNNSTLRRQLAAIESKRATVLGYTPHMATLMRGSDLLVTKPGGLSSTEAVRVGIPLIHTAAIPGCEILNARYFSGHGYSRFCPSGERLPHEVLRLLLDEDACRDMVEKQRLAFRQEDPAEKICDLAEKL